MELAATGLGVLSPVRPGAHGYLLFEAPAKPGNRLLVDGPALGRLLADTGVGVLVLNACRSAYADTPPPPGGEAGDGQTDIGDAHGRIRAYGSLAQEVADAGVAGVVAMRYSVYVDTAARVVATVYKQLLDGHSLGESVGAALRQLATDPHRKVVFRRLPLQDWAVPLVYEAAPLPLLSHPTGDGGLILDADARSQSAAVSSTVGCPGRRTRGSTAGTRPCSPSTGPSTPARSCSCTATPARARPPSPPSSPAGTPPPAASTTSPWAPGRRCSPPSSTTGRWRVSSASSATSSPDPRGQRRPLAGPRPTPEIRWAQPLRFDRRRGIGLVWDIL
jgi:CHAT domain